MSNLSPVEVNIAQSILTAIDDREIIPDSLKLMSEYLKSESPDPSVVTAIYKANIAAIVALRSLDIKSQKTSKVENHQHLTLNFTAEAWNQLPVEQREYFERFKLAVRDGLAPPAPPSLVAEHG